MKSIIVFTFGGKIACEKKPSEDFFRVGLPGLPASAFEAAPPRRYLSSSSESSELTDAERCGAFRFNFLRWRVPFDPTPCAGCPVRRFRGQKEHRDV